MHEETIENDETGEDEKAANVEASECENLSIYVVKQKIFDED